MHYSALFFHTFFQILHCPIFFSGCTFSVSHCFRVSLFLSFFLFSSCCSFFILQLFLVALFWCMLFLSLFMLSLCFTFLTVLVFSTFLCELSSYWILFMLRFSRVAPHSCCFFMLHFSCYTFFVLQSIHVALPSVNFFKTSFL